jgi:chemotaxis protein CheD
MIRKEQLYRFVPTTSVPRMNSVPGEVQVMAKEFLHPGQMYVSSKPSTVTTIVGSCVAVCLWDPILRSGGVTHYILAQWDGAGQPSPRYGDIAIELLVNKMAELGSYRHKLQAHVFGGACIFESLRERKHSLSVMNIEIALEMLAKYNIKVLTQQVGGRKGRKIVYQTSDGSFTVKEV